MTESPTTEMKSAVVVTVISWVYPSCTGWETPAAASSSLFSTVQVCTIFWATDPGFPESGFQERPEHVISAVIVI